MIRLPLDTHAFLWFIADDPQLSVTATNVIGDLENERFLSMANIWEIAIKVQIGKLRLPSPLDQFLEDQFAKNQVQLLPIEFTHAVRVHSLPTLRMSNGKEHKDPFDRLIISQALTEGLAVVSIETVFDQYGVTRYW